MKHAAIIPLIGGEVLAADEVWLKRPEYLLTYSPFAENEKHLLNYYKNQGEHVPYLTVDKGETPPYPVDVISTVCPCAGLSQYHSKAGADNPNNQWMERTANYVLGELKPKVFYGENAPGLVGKIGEFMLAKLRQIGLDNGYSMSVFLTKNILHGVPQFRKRTFYFFWKKSEFGEKAPIFSNISRDYQHIEDLILGIKSNFQQEPINKRTPSKDCPYYRYLLEEVHGGISHREYFDLLVTNNVRTNDAESLIETYPGHDYLRLRDWMLKNGYDREAPKCERKYHKLKAGGNIMRRTTIVPKDYIGAFVGHYPNMLTHPHEDRYITYREAMSIMGLPSDYELLDPEKSVNHICQNVPFQTAKDMAGEVKAVLDGDRTFYDSDFIFQNNFNGSVTSLVKEENTLEKYFE